MKRERGQLDSTIFVEESTGFSRIRKEMNKLRHARSSSIPLLQSWKGHRGHELKKWGRDNWSRSLRKIFYETRGARVLAKEVLSSHKFNGSTQSFCRCNSSNPAGFILPFWRGQPGGDENRQSKLIPVHISRDWIESKLYRKRASKLNVSEGLLADTPNIIHSEDIWGAHN